MSERILLRLRYQKATARIQESYTVYHDDIIVYDLLYIRYSRRYRIADISDSLPFQNLKYPNCFRKFHGLKIHTQSFLRSNITKIRN